MFKQINLTMIKAKKIKLAIFITFTALIISSCDYNQNNFTNFLDFQLMNYIDKSLFHQIEEISLKQLHLEQAKFEGKHISVQGKIQKIGKGQTYLVIKQDKRKLLIIQIDIANFKKRADENSLGKNIKIIGLLGSARKGLPALKAKIIKKAD